MEAAFRQAPSVNKDRSLMLQSEWELLLVRKEQEAWDRLIKRCTKFVSKNQISSLPHGMRGVMNQAALFCLCNTGQSKLEEVS